MARCVPPYVLALIAALCLAGCGFFGRPERPVWRAQAENACFARKQVTLSTTIVAAPEIDGPGICGMTRPLKVSALGRRLDRGRQDPHHRLPDDPGAGGLANAIVAAGRAGPLRPEGRDTSTCSAPIAAGASTTSGRAAFRTRFRQCRRRRRLHPGRRAQDRLRPRLEEARHPGSRVPARGPRRRLPVFHHRARAGRRRLPLQPHPPRSRQPRLDRHGPPAHLQADARAEPLAAARPRPTACRPPRRSKSRSTSRMLARRGGRAVALAPMSLTGAADGPDGALPPGPSATPTRPSDPAGRARGRASIRSRRRRSATATIDPAVRCGRDEPPPASTGIVGHRG